MLLFPIQWSPLTFKNFKKKTMVTLKRYSFSIFQRGWGKVMGKDAKTQTNSTVPYRTVSLICKNTITFKSDTGFVTVFSHHRSHASPDSLEYFISVTDIVTNNVAHHSYRLITRYFKRQFLSLFLTSPYLPGKISPKIYA